MIHSHKPILQAARLLDLVCGEIANQSLSPPRDDRTGDILSEC